MSDNFRFDIASDGDITPWLRLVMHSPAVSWREVTVTTAATAGHMAPVVQTPAVFIIRWADKSTHPDANPFPVPMNADQIGALVTAWLETAKYPPAPDHDGDNKRGWHLYNEQWGHVGNDHYAIAAIAPSWQTYGK
jgi:hypothetical protein